jgi:hypothetical protein
MLFHPLIGLYMLRRAKFLIKASEKEKRVKQHGGADSRGFKPLMAPNGSSWLDNKLLRM